MQAADTQSTQDRSDQISNTDSNVTFFKKRSASKNLRKRKKSTSPERPHVEEDVISEVVTKERKVASNPLVQGTKRDRKDDEEDSIIGVKYNATKTANTDKMSDATRYDTEWLLQTEEQDKSKKSRKAVEKPKEVEEKKPTNSKMQRGPIRAPANLRVTARFDYQPDVCKDYKETGFCGYGDSCIFMHDRGDYKSGWQLEKEWEDAQKKKTQFGGGAGDQYAVESDDDDSDDELPFACLICRQEFTNPIVTKCGHYFCEKCAIKHYTKSPKCFACGASTNGIFNTAKNLMAKIEEKHAEDKKNGVTGDAVEIQIGGSDDDSDDDSD